MHWRGGALRLVELVDYNHYMAPMSMLPPVPANWGSENARGWRDEWRHRLETQEPWVLTWLREYRDGPWVTPTRPPPIRDRVSTSRRDGRVMGPLAARPGRPRPPRRDRDRAHSALMRVPSEPVNPAALMLKSPMFGHTGIPRPAEAKNPIPDRVEGRTSWLTVVLPQTPAACTNTPTVETRGFL